VIIVDDARSGRRSYINSSSNCIGCVVLLILIEVMEEKLVGQY
jgi:hypothetical protein